MRRILVTLLVMAVVLAACADRLAPTEPAPTMLPASSPRAPAPRPSPGTGHTPTAPAPPEAGPWPSFLRELDFGIPAGNSYGPRAVAVHPGLGRIYARTQTRDWDAPGQFTVMDSDTGQVLALVETGLDSYADGKILVDVERDRIYAINADEVTASVFDAETLKSIATMQGVVQLALDSEGGRIYVAGLGRLRVLDVEDYGTLEEAAVSYSPRFLDLAVAPNRGRLYVTYEETGAYYLGQYQASTLQELGTLPLPGQPEDLCPDPARERAYLSLSDGEQSLLWTIDDGGRLSDEQALGDWTETVHLALDAEADRLFLGREVHQDHRIEVLDLRSGKVTARIPLALAPKDLAWDAGAGRLLVSHTYDNQVGSVDVEGGALALFPTALNLIDLNLDPGRGHVYVTDSSGRLHILDSETDEELATLAGEGRIAVDGAHGRVYTGGEGAEQVHIFDSDSLQLTGEIETKALPVADAHLGQLYLVQNGIYLASLETMTVTTAISDTLPQFPGYNPNPSAVDAVVDPSSGRIFAIINNGVPGSNGGTYLYVYEPVTYQKVLTDTERSPTYLDVDPTTGRAYISRAHTHGQSVSMLEDGREYTARLERVFGALRVDPQLGYVYLSVEGEETGTLLVLGAETLYVLGSVPIPGGFSLRALDPHRQLLYLANREGQVQIWSTTGSIGTTPGRTVAERPPGQEIWRLFLGPGDTPMLTGRLYRSDDEGNSWQRVDHGLPEHGLQKVVVSPGFAEDGTLFAATMATYEGMGIWKSVDGGRSWRIASRGLTDLGLTDLAISPGYVTDQTLFATTAGAGGLFRSTDGGSTWERLADRYELPEGYPRFARGVFISPTFDRDQTLFVIHEVLHRSTDGGESWASSALEMSDLAISPAFTTDQTVFGWSEDGGVLRSTDGGATWQPTNAGLALTEYGSGRLLISPDYSASQTVYFFWDPGVSDAELRLFRSTDGAANWERLPGDPPEAATQFELSADGMAFLALDEGAGLIRWEIGELPGTAASQPRLSEIEIGELVISPGFSVDGIIYAFGEGAGILCSADRGLTWSDTVFPLRGRSALSTKLVAVAPDKLFIGTQLGLYRYEGGVWTLAGGGLPQGVAASSPEVGADESWRVLVGDPGEDQRVYLSTDGGQTWMEPVPPLPQPADVEALHLSPSFATDHTVILAPGWERPWRTVEGGPWNEFGPPGEWTVVSLQVAPGFDRNGLIFLLLDDGTLRRSTDGGDAWVEIDGPWGDDVPMGLSPGDSYMLEALTFSPAYAEDGVILTHSGSALYRSTDMGQTWTESLALGPSLAQAEFSPDYGRDGEILVLQGRMLYRSPDRGAHWDTLPAAPWTETDEVHLMLSPTFGQDDTLLAWTTAGRVYQSSDGGQSWRDISGGLPGGAIRQVVMPPDYARDGLVYLVPHGPGLYKRVGESRWISAVERPPAASPTSTPPPRTPVIAPTPPASTPVACQPEPVVFAEVWQQTHTQLGCPEEQAAPATLAEQALEHGRMLWESSTRRIYVLMESGSWQAFDDSFEEGIDPPYDANLPPPPKQPQRGFGKVWREELGGPEAAIGWALEGERPVAGWRQRFSGGLLIWTDAVLAAGEHPGTAYLLYADGTWEAIATPSP